jgi:periplasmic copper chaperone A
MRRILSIAGAAAFAALTGASPALAHITLASTEGEAGATFRAVLVVGHGCEGEATTSVRVQVPQGFYNVKPMPKSGWQLETVTGPYDKPFENHGTQITEGVTEITWSGGSLPDTQFDEFTFRGTFGAGLAAGSTFYFPVLQYCGDKESPWIDTSGDPDAETPAPGVVIKEGSGEHHH